MNNLPERLSDCTRDDHDAYIGSCGCAWCNAMDDMVIDGLLGVESAPSLHVRGHRIASNGLDQKQAK